MKIIRHLCDTYPAYRKLFVGFGYGIVIFGGAIWYICLLIPSLALTFLDPSHLLLASHGISIAARTSCWFCAGFLLYSDWERSISASRN